VPAASFDGGRRPNWTVYAHIAGMHDRAMTSHPPLDAALDHAAAAGLTSFVLCEGVGAIEYEAIPATEPRRYQPSGRDGTIAIAQNGNRRLNLPPQRQGHVITTWPDLVISVYLNLDLIRRGYFYLHFVSTGTVTSHSTWALLSRNLATRAWRVFRKRPMPWTFATLARSQAPAYRPIKNRVLMVIPSFVRGGSERQMLITAEALALRGYEVCVLALRALDSGEPSYQDEIANSGLMIRIVPNDLNRHPSPHQAVTDVLRPYADTLPVWMLAFADGVVRTIRDFRPAVVHCWLDQAAVIGGLAACTLGVPRIIAGQLNVISPDVDPKELQFYRNGYLALGRNTAVLFINNSRAGAVSYSSWLGYEHDRIRVLPNIFLSTTVRTPHPDEVSEFRARHNLRSGEPVIGTMIRFVPQKDPELWLDAAAIIVAAHPRAQFLICGYGPLEAAMRRRIQALGISDCVIIPGAVTDIGLVYAAIDVFMLSSRYEGLPYTLIEAQAAGRPVVATDVGGNAEGFADGRTGRLVRDRSAQALAAAVIDILDQAALWKERVATEGPAFVHQHFGLDEVVDQTLHIYGFHDACAGGAPTFMAEHRPGNERGR
jgi:glycosyltransferase involved in cell wall biosynthesis